MLGAPRAHGISDFSKLRLQILISDHMEAAQLNVINALINATKQYKIENDIKHDLGKVFNIKYNSNFD